MKTLTAVVSLFVVVLCADAQQSGGAPALKKRIAVTHFDNKSNYQGQAELGTGFADSLADALIKTGRFIVVERAEIKNVMQEQDFAVSGRTAETTTGPKIGQLLTAQIQITGSITHVETQASEGGAGFGFKGFSIGGSGGTATVTIALRIIDTTSGQVLDSQQIKGVAKKSGMSIGFANRDFGGSMSSLKKTPLGDAVIDAINQSVAAITSRLENVPWQGRIVKAEGDKIFINAGANFGVRVGDRFTCYKPGQAMIDPDTGLNLGSKDTKYGQIEVVEVSEKFSVCKPAGGTGFADKDVIKIQ